ncbi:hypothetical protein GCM10010358_09630 [Streptomyces minutiscleroticus]|uniref:Uncharacterized protein n=1 Tax=Streptomyces minutiscleroticus TaxID=68238 RepID=A0A918NC53_9ACTN|nr:hypothetical protein [Streptomyces minutiscleroticus]GGX57561.1 hypothetical protein GCM10010358_09630 [Streptomyces minutiscleroticus]
MPVETREDPFEDRLGDALRRAGGSFETDRAALAAGGAARGHRALRRRRAAVLTGGVAGVALLGVGGALLVPAGSGDDGQRSVAARQATPSPGREPAAVSGADLLRTLKGLLPEGGVSGEHARGTDEGLTPYAHVVYDDGEGGAAVEVSLGRTEEAAACPDRVFTPYDSCEEEKLDDGSALVLFRGYEYADRREDTKRWYAELVTPQGQQVTVTEWNAEEEKGAPVSREEPPLTTAQLAEIAAAPEWREAVDAVPGPGASAPAGTGSEAPSAAEGTGVRKTLAGLMPRGVKVVADGGQAPEYAYVVVDDGKGESFVQVNVQPDITETLPPNTRSVADQLFGSGAETLPDGTKLTTQQGPGDDKGLGLVMWTVDTMRTDGLRVVVSAFNSGSQVTGPTRDTPALGMDDLRRIATSKEWDRLR